MSNKKFFPVLLLVITLFISYSGSIKAQSSYDEYINYFKDFDFSKRVVPVIPPKDELINVIIDADAKNEIDDQWALTLALLSPELFGKSFLIFQSFNFPVLQIANSSSS